MNTTRSDWNPVICPVALTINGISQTPEKLVKNALSNNVLNVEIENNFQQRLTFQFTEDRKQFGLQIYENPSTSFLISHCHFSEITENGRHSLSACSPQDVTGFLLTENNRFGLFPKDDKFYLKPYVINSCDLEVSRVKKRAINNVIDRNPPYIQEHLDGRKRYVELALVADYSLYTKYDSDEKKVNDYLQKTVNILNSLYHPLNIFVTISHSEIWKNGNQITVVADSGATLNNFMDYKKLMLKDYAFDTGYLITTLRFGDGVVGKAFKGTMCSYDYSGGVYVDHSEDIIETVATFAHELGHTFGMDHDPNDKDACYCPMPKCIMAPQSGHMEVWSECSVKNLASGFHRGIDLCLFNEPGQKASDAKCGNGIVENGEECDCGPLHCDNNCCDGKTCKLIGDAQCATGDCCDLKTCMPKPRATVCRAAINTCDLPEFCNGETNFCPADFFVQNGASCPGRENEFCYEGSCGSRNDQCRKLWGLTGTKADDNCDRKNVEGSIYGNCGFNPHTKEYKKCSAENVKCGTLHCETQSERPVYGDPASVTFTHFSVYSKLRPSDRKFCYVYKSVNGGLQQIEPGLVPDGASCGADDMCVDQKCQKKSQITKVTPQCLENCNYRGICNNVGNCHCERGFGGISCEIPGYGGSVNSNEAFQFRGMTLSTAFITFFILFGFLISGVCIYFRVKKKRNLISEWWSFIKKKFDLHGDLVPIRKAPPPPFTQRIRQSFTAMWSEDAVHSTIQPSNHLYASNSTNTYMPRDPPLIPMISLNKALIDQMKNELPNEPPPSKRAPSENGISRTGSLRPSTKPPPIPRPSENSLNKLKEELNDEKPRTEFHSIKQYSQKTASLPSPRPQIEKPRPDVAPPLPPHKVAADNNVPISLPNKPPVIKSNFVENENIERIDVRSVAAMFDRNLKKQRE